MFHNHRAGWGQYRFQRCYKKIVDLDFLERLPACLEQKKYFLDLLIVSGTESLAVCLEFHHTHGHLALKDVDTSLFFNTENGIMFLAIC